MENRVDDQHGGRDILRGISVCELVGDRRELSLHKARHSGCACRSIGKRMVQHGFRQSKGARMRYLVVSAVSALLMVCTALAQESDGRRADELKKYLDLESTDTNVKLDLILHQLHEVNQKIVTLSFIQRYGDEITSQTAKPTGK